MVVQRKDMDVDDATQKALLLDCAPLCALILDTNGHARVVNKLFIELMGPLYKFSEYPFAQVAAEDEGKATLSKAIDKVRSGESSRERLRNLKMITLAGESGLPIKSHFDWCIGSSGQPGEVALYGDPCSDDLLEQRHKDAELVDFFQNAPIALHWLSGTGHVLWANQTELDVLGYTAEEYIGQPIMKFCPDEEELVLEIFKTLGSGNIIKDVPVRFRTKAGKVVPLLIDSNVAYTTDEKGEKAFGHTRCFIRDDTGRRMREARAAAMLEETRRSLKLLDSFISRTLHVVKTPCHVVQQSLGLLSANLESLSASGFAKTHPTFVAETDLLLNHSMRQMEDVAALINDASDVIRFEQGSILTLVPTSVELKPLGRSLIDDTRATAPSGVTVSLELSAAPELVHLDGKLLRRALHQLLSNAIDATKKTKKGSITLRVSAEVAPAGAWPPLTGESKPKPEGCGGPLSSQSRLRFEVIDTGHGLPSSLKGTASRGVFERYAPGASPLLSSPMAEAHEMEKAVEDARKGLEGKLSFTATKTTGLGIGLNLTYGLVRAMGGELRYESEPGDTRFWFVIPAEIASGAEVTETYTPHPRTPEDANKPSALRKTSLKEWDRGQRRPPRTRTATSVSASRSDACSGSRCDASSDVCSDAGSFDSGTAGSSPLINQKSPPPTPTRFVADKEHADKLSAPSSAIMDADAFEDWLAFEDPPVCTKVVEASSIAGQGLRAFDPPHVLIVEDTDMCSMVLEMLLGDLGCSSDIVEDGQEALDKLRAVDPDLYSLILMDLRMPVMDGFEATEAIKNTLKLTTPVIALTADDTQESRVRCEKIGFDDFASKPLSAEALAALLQKHVGHKVAPEK